MAWCDAISRSGERIGDEVAARLRGHFADHEIVELTLTAGGHVDARSLLHSP